MSSDAHSNARAWMLVNIHTALCRGYRSVTSLRRAGGWVDAQRADGIFMMVVSACTYDFPKKLFWTPKNKKMDDTMFDWPKR